MSYLSREQRREHILQAAMRVALNEGFAAMTVRRIACEAGVATGQVHHHFTSGAELKSQAFIRTIRALLDIDVLDQDASWHEQLHSMLGSNDGRFENHIRLWREAQILAAKDDDIKGAYTLSMEMWHEETVKIIRQGCEAGEFTLSDSAENIAWRLISLVCGLDGLYVLGMASLDEPAFESHLTRLIRLELG
ncbi:TetR family transcriptional regulator [Superficieibacter electus]|uniref:TetR family transcriptional regulator n=1 Tax=Superficieibacter electus TaxID=2022662 RepID=A0A2P5GUM8_9ENTR|nr:TetR family transcriptional regulator [Superficieibacter electus]POP40911.1 TetR family transcriptional regulator [Superficieibacter electus]POP50261.1 TetR family transcriptional regulator [Superficieibacter electus]